jgi:hypothetical protein
MLMLAEIQSFSWTPAAAIIVTVVLALVGATWLLASLIIKNSTQQESFIAENARRWDMHEKDHTAFADTCRASFTEAREARAQIELRVGRHDRRLTTLEAQHVLNHGGGFSCSTNDRVREGKG